MVAWQQLSGINVVLLYSETIFLKTGVDLSASVSTIIVGTVMLVAAAVTPTLAKMTTMRMLLYISAIGMAITDVSIVYILIFWQPFDNGNIYIICLF